jgi:hypothetical protein
VQKILPALVLGIIVYGCMFSANYPALEPVFNVWDARTTLEPKEPLGLLDGVHNGFVAFGNTVASYGNFIATQVGSFFRLAGEDHGFGVIRWLGYIAVSLLIKFVFAVLGLFLHFAFYVALVFKLFFVAATPLYHIGFLAATGVTWLLLAAVANAAEEAEREAGAQE